MMIGAPRDRFPLLATTWLATDCAGFAGTTIDPMVPLFHKWQMAGAPEAVAKAAATGAQRVQFCIALQSPITKEKRLEAFGLYRGNRNPSVGGNRLGGGAFADQSIIEGIDAHNQSVREPGP